MYRGCLLLIVLQVTLAEHKSRMVVESEYPHVVFIQNLRHNKNFTGSIIASKWVLTAAHCLQPNTAYKVQAGFSTSGGHLQTRKVVSGKKHSKFSLDYVPYYDLALLQVDEPFKFNKYVGNVGIAVSPPPHSPNSCYVVGFQGKGLERIKRLSTRLHSKGQGNLVMDRRKLLVGQERDDDDDDDDKTSCLPPKGPRPDDATCRTPGQVTGGNISDGAEETEEEVERTNEEDDGDDEDPLEYMANVGMHRTLSNITLHDRDGTLYRRNVKGFTDCSKVTAKNRPAQHLCSGLATRLGDTGAPLMCSHVQAGVASAVRHPDKLDTIEIYTELEPFRCWIYETVPGAQFYSFNTRLGWKLANANC